MNKKSPKWDALATLAGQIPGVTPFAQGIARNTVQRMLGFWVMWHVFGGQDGLLEAEVMAASTMYRQMSEFRAVFGVDVADWCPDLSAKIAEARDEGDDGGEA